MVTILKQNTFYTIYLQRSNPLKVSVTFTRHSLLEDYFEVLRYLSKLDIDFFILRLDLKKITWGFVSNEDSEQSNTLLYACYENGLQGLILDRNKHTKFYSSLGFLFEGCLISERFQDFFIQENSVFPKKIQKMYSTF